MRVLMVTRETGNDRRYGLGRSLAPLLQPMAEAGVHVRYFCQEDMAPHAIAGRQRWIDRASRLPLIRHSLPRQNLARAWLERLHVGAAAARVAAEEGYTHVHAHDPWLAAGVALRLSMVRGSAIRWGFTQHGFGSYSHATHEDGLEQGPAAQRLMRRVEGSISARADWVTAPTAASLAQLARDLGLPRLPMHWRHVPHARPALAAATAQARNSARAARGWSDDDCVVLAVGRLVPLKCFDRVVRACAQQGNPRIRLLVLGSGDAAELHALARELDFGGQLQVAFVEDVSSCFHAADIYVSASSTESFGMANLEALCAGVPAVCTAVGGVPEVIGDGGWLVPNDVGVLTRAVGALVGDDRLRDFWKQRGLQRAAQWPTAQEIAARYVAIYQAA